MRRLLNALALLGLLAFCSMKAVFGAPGPEIPPEVKKSVSERVDQGLSVGIVVGVVDSEGTTYFGHGKLSRRSDREVDADTIFEIGSTTKVFTTILLADLVQQGALSLDDPIDQHLPESVTVPTRGGKKITLRDLATHRSGLPRMPTNFDPADPENPYADYDTERLYEFISSYRLTRDIGSKYEYSNLGMGLLGHILTRVSGKSYERLVIGRICRPLGMRSTRVKLSRVQGQRMAVGHAGDREAKNWDLDSLAGAGALRSSAKDLLEFLAANIGLKETKLYSAMQLTHEERYETGVPKLDIALGWHVWTKHGTEIIWHNGGTGGYRSFFGFVPKKRLGVVVLSNSTESIDDIGLHLLEGRYDLEVIKKATPVAPSVLAEYAGYYELQPGAVFDITRERDQLFAQLTGQDKFPVYPSSETEFFYRVIEAQLTFVKDDDGEVVRLILHQNGRDLPARRLGPEYKPLPPRVAVSIEPEILARYAGKYELAPGVVFDVTTAKDKLLVQITGQPRVPVFPESPTKFFYKAVEAQITFVVGGDGKVSHLVLHQGGRDQKAKKID